jgi:hypothetical protein
MHWVTTGGKCIKLGYQYRLLKPQLLTGIVRCVFTSPNHALRQHPTILRTLVCPSPSCNHSLGWGGTGPGAPPPPLAGPSKWQATGTSKARRPANKKRSWAVSATLLPAAGGVLGYDVGLQATATLTALRPGRTSALAAGLEAGSMTKAAACGPTGTTSNRVRRTAPWLSRAMVFAAVAALRLVWPKSLQEVGPPGPEVGQLAATVDEETQASSKQGWQ